MNKNEIKYLDTYEPTPQELDARLLHLAIDEQTAGMDFYWFLIGWMSPGHHAEMAEAARAWLDIHHPDKLEEFDSLNKG